MSWKCFKIKHCLSFLLVQTYVKSSFYVETNFRVLSSSRFDLIYLILDKADEQTDRRLAKHIVSLHFENPEVLLLFFGSFLIDNDIFKLIG